MNLRTLIQRSLRFHWRSHLGVVIGAAIGSAALIGALIVGDSVKGSLRERALERVGNTSLALSSGDRFFKDSLMADALASNLNPFSNEDSFKSVEHPEGGGVHWALDGGTFLNLPGVALRQDGTARASQVQVYGITGPRAFLPPTEVAKDEKQLGQWLGSRRIQMGQVVLNEALAEHLAVKPGDAILLRIRKPSALSQDAMMVSRDENSVVLRLTVQRIATSAERGNLSLAAGQAPPLNAFVRIEELGESIGLPHRANLLLLPDLTEPTRGSSWPRAAEWVRRVWFQYILRRKIPNPANRPLPTAIQVREATRLLKRNWHSGHLQYTFTGQSDNRWATLTTERIFLEPAVARAATTPRISQYSNFWWMPDTSEKMQDAANFKNTSGILSYLANLITVGTNATPYSIVTAAGAPWTPPDLRNDEIVLNQWLADDLQAKPGDALTLVYFDPESGARITERTNTFRVHSIVPMQMPWSDRTLMPQFPGIEKAETTAEWDTAFPLVHKIRPQDDKYWQEHRGTPKAFVTLATGQKMWANRFGDLTALRWPIPGNTNASRYAQSLEFNLLANLNPTDVGLRFEPVREQALKAAEQSQDFGGLFIGFSLFVIVAALLLMAMLFQFSLEQRAAEIGTFLALGFTPNQVRRLFLREGAALALLGGILGTIGGIGYARGMLLGLSTIWRDAVGASSLKFFVTTQTLLIGLLASTLVAVFTLWLALRKQARQPARVLLAGEDGGLGTKEGGAKRNRAALYGGINLIAAFILVAWTLARGDTANAGAFFGAGALVLIAGLCLLNARLTRRSQPSSILHPPPSSQLALRGLTRRRSRSVATAAMLASGTFLIVSIGVFRLDANRDATKRASGTGGFSLIGESTMPVVADLNTQAGRESFALNEADFTGVNFVQFRVRAGDEASCLNLNRAQNPRLLGVKPEAMVGSFTFVKGEGWPSLGRGRREESLTENGETDQRLLTSSPTITNEVAAIGDAASIQWAMGKKVGDTLDYVDERGQPFKVRIVGAVANSILQGQLIIDEAEFVKRFQSESGYKYFLIDAPTNRTADVSAKLSRALQDVGLELTPAPQRLAQFNAVQNTYLGTFQILGGLGLLLGSAGLGIVVLRNVLERRAELGLLLAVGWRRHAVNQLVLREHLALLGLGLAVGLIAAVVAVLPSLLMPGAAFPWFTLGLTLVAVLANGVLWTWLAARVALRGELLSALRGE